MLTRPAYVDILLIEDDKGIGNALIQILEDEDYDVVAAVHGLAALEYLHGERLPRVILLDLMMLVMDGRQFRHAQQQDPALATIPTVIISADTDVPRNAAALNASAYLEKPVDRNQLFDLVERFCA